MTLGILRRRRLEKILLDEYADLHRLAWSWTHDNHAAEDLVQEACARAMEQAHQLKDDGKARPWVVKIMVNLHRDRHRARREFVDAERLHLVSGDSAESLVQQEDSINQVRNAVAMLSHDQRMVLTMVDLMEFTYVQVAETLDIPIGTVMSRLARARGGLKERLLSKESGTTGQPALRRVK